MAAETETRGNSRARERFLRGGPGRDAPGPGNFGRRGCCVRRLVGLSDLPRLLFTLIPNNRTTASVLSRAHLMKRSPEIA